MTSPGFSELMCKLTEQGHTEADAQIKELLTDIQYSENLYALKYILKHEGNSVLLETLITDMESFCPQTNDKAYSEDMLIRLEWQLRTVITILQQLHERKHQFTSQIASMYTKTSERIMHRG